MQLVFLLVRLLGCSDLTHDCLVLQKQIVLFELAVFHLEQLLLMLCLLELLNEPARIRDELLNLFRVFLYLVCVLNERLVVGTVLALHFASLEKEALVAN